MTIFNALVLRTQALTRREEGQTMAEYGVILAVISVGVIAALTALSGGVQNTITNIVGYL
jgi:Flp pilus assembly pilin Flp